MNGDFLAPTEVQTYSYRGNVGSLLNEPIFSELDDEFPAERQERTAGP